jgi:hypothetical protein
MFKRCNVIIALLFSFVFCGCSCSKKDLIEENNNLLNNINEIKSGYDKYKGLDGLFNWYNTITAESVNSFVIVESRESNNVLYTDGVVVARSGYSYYILADYSKIRQYGNVSFRVMDSNANVYSASVFVKNGNAVYDTNNGLILLKVDAIVSQKAKMESIALGKMDDLTAIISSEEHINKVHICENIKTSTITYHDTSYDLYNEEESFSGAMINSSHNLVAFYSSSYNGFISTSLIKETILINYSLAL